MFKTRIARNLKRIIINRDISIDALAKKSNVDNKTISSFINDRDNISLNKLCDVIKALDVDIDYKKVQREIGTNTRKKRESIGFSMNQLAVLIGGGHSTISKYEACIGNMTLDYMIKLADALDISPRELYPFNELDVSLVDMKSLNVRYDGPEFDESTLDNEFDERDAGTLSASKKVPLYYVIDGDTLKVGGLKGDNRVRLLVIDTPETIKKSEQWGLVAKQFVKNLIDPDSEIIIQQDPGAGARGIYDRPIAWVWIQRKGKYQLLNYIMVKAGFSTAKHKQGKNLLYLDDLERAEKNAKKNQRVLWGYKYLDPYWDYVKDKPKEKYWQVKCDGLFMKVEDYEMTKISFTEEGTKFRSEEEAKFAKEKAIKFNYETTEITSDYEGEYKDYEENKHE